MNIHVHAESGGWIVTRLSGLRLTSSSPDVGHRRDSTLSKSLRILIVLLSPLTVLVTITAGAATPNGKVVLARALSDASKMTSMTIAGTVSESGTRLSLDGGFTPEASGGATTVQGSGTSVEIQPNGAKYGYVKANSIAALGNQLEIKKPTSSEINVWYKITSKDPRFSDIFGSGADTVAQTFSFSPVGWSRSATYEGTVVLRGVRLIKSSAAANLFVGQNGFAKETLYVTDATRPLPFAMTGPVGTKGLIYFSKWNATTVTIPNATTALPR